MEEIEMVVIDIHGTPHEIPKTQKLSFDVYAKWSGNKYRVLASNDGNLFDILDANNNIHRKDKERGGSFWVLRTCSKECYEQYVAFLRSRNRTPFILAQRRFRNDF
jgi:hypothetical protein